MDLHTVKVRLQEHLSDGLVTIVGSGLSCAEGLPGMGELANYLLAEIGGGLTGPDAAAWTAVSPLVKTKGLEAAISAATGKLISERERTVTRLAAMLAELPHPPFEHVVVDEAQDVSVSQLRCLAAMGATAGKVRPNSLFFAGDLGQRIFQLPFSWKALGVDVRGRSRTLHINYRTSHQIRRQADQLLGPEVSDVDGNVEDRRGTVSVFNGPAPDVRAFDSEAAEIAAVAEWLKQCAADGLAPHELAVFVRSDAQLPRALQAMKAAGLPHRTLDARVNTEFGEASVCTMHLAKGLEFRAVVVMACDDEVLPLQERMGAITDEADLEEIYNTERHLLYVACTRARDRLLVTSVDG